MSDYRADNDWLRNEMATNMIYKKEADELRAEIDRLQAALGDASIKLKLLYMAAGLGEKTGRDALAALNDEITKIDAALAAKDTTP